MDISIKEIKVTNANFWYTSKIKKIYTSKGNEIIQDYQRCALGMWFPIAGKDNVAVVPGDYACVLSPSVTSVFTNESWH